MCGERYRLAYQEGRSQRASVPMLTGSVVHAVAAVNLRRKSTGDGLMCAEELGDCTRDTFREMWSVGVDMLPDDQTIGQAVVYGNAVDRSLALARVHATKLAPMIRPGVGGVEKPWVVEVDGYPWDLAGEIDVEEPRILAEDGETILYPSAIRDLKTTGKKPNQKTASAAIQLSTYAMAYEAEHKELPDRVFFDYAMSTKAGTPDAGSIGSVRRPEHIEAFWHRLDVFAAMIEKQVFFPSRPYLDWWCSPEQCPFARIDPDTGVEPCKYFRAAPTFVALSFATGTGASGNGTKRATENQRQQLLDEL